MKHLVLLSIVFLGACAAEPPRHGEVVTMRAGEVPATGYPGPGTVWRLDEKEMRALSPAPLVPAPPPRRPPPPRPNAWYPPPPYYGAPPHWGPGY